MAGISRAASSSCLVARSSTYASTGWAVQNALRDQITVLNTFDRLVSHPTRTIAWDQAASQARQDHGAEGLDAYQYVFNSTYIKIGAPLLEYVRPSFPTGRPLLEGVLDLTRRIHAERAHWADNLNRWIYEQGWERTLRGSAIADFRPYDVATFPEVSEPPSYFKKEVKQYSEMNYEELRRYIHDLQQSGFDVVRLKVQLHQKISFPLITLVMAILAVPFSLSAGKKGPIGGVATAVGIAVVYIVVLRLFEGIGNVSQLPPALAAWSPDLIFALAGGYLILKVPT